MTSVDDVTSKILSRDSIILQMCSCDQSLVTVVFLWEKLSKTAFFEGWSWFKFNNLGLALGTNLKFYTSVAKGLKLKVRKFLGLIHTFVEVAGEKMGGGCIFGLPPSWIGLTLFVYNKCNISSSLAEVVFKHNGCKLWVCIVLVWIS